MLKLVFVWLVVALCKLASADDYQERLSVDLLPDSNALLHFNFKLDWTQGKSDRFENYGLFPKQFGDIVSKFNVDELKLSLSQGTWRHQSWGLPAVSAPSGSELFAQFSTSVESSEIESTWLQLSRSISGYFGLSINLNDNPNTAVPLHAIKSLRNDSSRLRYVSIPNEIVCTENFTPWIKLVPCGKSKGVAQLFKKTHKLFEAHYLLANLHFTRTCSDDKCEIHKLELVQTLSLVYNMEHVTKQIQQDDVEWKLSSVFGRIISATCPAASSTQFSFRSNKIGVSGSATDSNEDITAIISKSGQFDPVIQQSKKAKLSSFPSFVTLHRYVTDQKERNFGLKTIIENKHNENATLVYFDTIPWYFRTFINTLQIRNEKTGQLISPDLIHFVAGRDRVRPHQIEIGFTVPAHSTFSIYFRAECAHLKWDEYPPDVNHGFYINPALISVQIQHKDLLRDTDSGESTSSFRIYSETLLLNLPTPDFSMPYNVICLTCTVVAIGFGSFHNFTTRKFKFFATKTLKQRLTGLLKRRK